MIVEIKRKFSCTYGILEVETEEGGCTETFVRTGIESIQAAIVILESIPEDGNCSYYIVIEYEELPV